MSVLGGKGNNSSLKGYSEVEAGNSLANTHSCAFDLSQFGCPMSSVVERRAIEPRILLDAAAGETAEMIVGEVAQQQAADWAEAVSQTTDKEIDGSNGVEPAKVEIAFVDASVENYQTIVDEMGPNIQIVIIERNSDGIHQIADHLEGQNDVDAIHIISHGKSGTLNLGDAKLTSDTINGEYADEMLTIKSALGIDADILIYGCDFGAGLRGSDAVNALVNATGADVAASYDLTGATHLGGDWDLEFSQGQIETSAFKATEFLGVLADNVAPTLDLDASDTTATGLNYEATFTENGTPINIAASDTIVNDVDGNISAITITLTTGQVGDLIGTPAEMPGGITFEASPSGNLDVAGQMVISLVGNADTTNADWSLLLQSMTLLPSTKDSDNPNETDRIFNFLVTDLEGLTSVIATSTIHVATLNDPGSLDLDVDDSSLNTQGGFNGSFIENSGGAPLHTDMIIIDYDSENLVYAKVVFDNPLVDDQLIIDSELIFDQGALVQTSGTVSGIGFTVVLNDGRVEILLSGEHAVADYQTALESIRFNNTSDVMDLTLRTFQTTISDGGEESSPRTSFISMLKRNDAPIANYDYGITDQRTALILTPLDNDSDIEGDDFKIIRIDNRPIEIGGSVRLSSGTLVTLNSDGSITFDPAGVYDELPIGQKVVQSFVYTIADNGQSPTPAQDGTPVDFIEPLTDYGVIQITIIGKALRHVEEHNNEVHLHKFLVPIDERNNYETSDKLFSRLIDDIDPLAVGTGLFDLDAPIGEVISEKRNVEVDLNFNAEGQSVSQLINWMESTRLKFGRDLDLDSMGFKMQDHVGGESSLRINGHELSLMTLGSKDRILLQLKENNRFYDIEIESVNGRAIPSWIDRYDDSLIVLTSPAGLNSVDIVLNASGVNGNEFKIQFKLDFFTGTMKLSGASNAYLHKGFSGELMALEENQKDEVRTLLAFGEDERDEIGDFINELS